MKTQIKSCLGVRSFWGMDCLPTYESWECRYI